MWADHRLHYDNYKNWKAGLIDVDPGSREPYIFGYSVVIAFLGIEIALRYKEYSRTTLFR